MVMVRKRGGDIVRYDPMRIFKAIDGAFHDKGMAFSDSRDADRIMGSIEDRIVERGVDTDQVVGVEDIQDIVENVLLDYGLRNVAKEYIRYRYKHEIERRKKIDKQIEDKLLAKQIDNQNANIDEHSFGGRMGEANGIMMKEYALSHCMSKMARDNHLNNEIYIHDLDQYAIGTHNCLSIPFDDLLANGFNTRQTDVRPANSINTAFQLIAVIFQLQSLMQFGGVAATHLDWTMVPYVRKSFYKHYKDGLKYLTRSEDIPDEITPDTPIDSELYKNWSVEEVYDYAMDKTVQETHQAVEGMYHNLSY